jgi:TetR/AcrR family transcriptional regulator, transcriptional repressor of bet genes
MMLTLNATLNTALSAKKNEDLRLKRGEDTRLSLIMATINVVAEKGLAYATLNAVAKLAGVSTSLVVFHFSSKELLLDAALQYALGTYDLSLKQTLASVGCDGLSQVKAYLSHDMHFASKHSALLSLCFATWGEVRATKKYRLSLLPVDHGYRNDIAKNLEKILKDKKKAQQRAVIVDRFIYGVWLDSHIDPDSFDLSEYLQIANDLSTLVAKP